MLLARVLGFEFVAPFQSASKATGVETLVENWRQIPPFWKVGEGGQDVSVNFTSSA